MRDRDDRHEPLVLALHDLLVLDEAVIDAHVRDARRQRRAKEMERAFDVAHEMCVAQCAGALGQRDPFGAQPGDDQRRLGGADQRALQRRRARLPFGVASLRQRARIDDRTVCSLVERARRHEPFAQRIGSLDDGLRVGPARCQARAVRRDPSHHRAQRRAHRSDQSRGASAARRRIGRREAVQICIDSVHLGVYQARPMEASRRRGSGRAV